MNNYTFFESFTQYDASFNNIWAQNPNAKKGLACPYFSLFTAQQFMNDFDISQNIHKQNLVKAININVLL